MNTMKTLRTLAVIVVLVAMLAWSLGPLLRPPSGLHSASWSYADLVRDRYPIHLVDPEWVSPTESWTITEAGARIGLLIIVLIVVTLFLTNGKRNSKEGS